MFGAKFFKGHCSNLAKRSWTTKILWDFKYKCEANYGLL